MLSLRGTQNKASDQLARMEEGGLKVSKVFLFDLYRSITFIREVRCPVARLTRSPGAIIMEKPAGAMVDRQFLDDEPAEDIHLAIILKANKPTIFIGPHLDASRID